MTSVSQCRLRRRRQWGISGVGRVHIHSLVPAPVRSQRRHEGCRRSECLQPPRSSTSHSHVCMSSSVHSRTLFIQAFCCPSLRLLPSTAWLSWHETWSHGYHDCVLLFTVVSGGSCAHVRQVIRLWTKSLVWISAQDTCNRRRKHLFSNARIFVNAPDTVQFSQPQIEIETARACWVLSLLLLRGLFGSGPLCPTVHIW